MGCNLMFMRRSLMWVFAIVFVLVTAGPTTLFVLWGLQRPGAVIVRSDPPGAMVFDANREIGVTPIRFHVLRDEYRQLRFVKRGYADRTVLLDGNAYTPSHWRHRLRAVVNEPEAELLVTLTVESSSSLRVTSDPPGAELFVGGIRVGITPFARQGMRPGRYIVRVTRKDYFSQEKEILLEPGKEERAHLVLQSKTETFYRELIASRPTFLPHYSDLIHYYLLKGDVDQAAIVMNDGFAATRRPNPIEPHRYYAELVHSYTRYYTYPADVDEALLRKTVRDIFARVGETKGLNPKQLKNFLKQLNNYDKRHPLPEKNE